jgi:hypothetical protein
MVRGQHKMNHLRKIKDNLYYHKGFDKFYMNLSGDYHQLKSDKRLRKKYLKHEISERKMLEKKVFSSRSSPKEVKHFIHEEAESWLK